MGGVRDWEYQSHPIFENQVKIKQSIESMSAIFFSRLGKRGDSLLSCASEKNNGWGGGARISWQSPSL